MLWPTVLRTWLWIGMGDTDQRLRVLGLIAGLALLAAIWTRARMVDRGWPIFALSLLALNPLIIRWGDSIRAYGLGLAAMILMLSALWRLTQKANWKNYLLAAVTALIACQLLYYNTIVLFALAVAGSIVCLGQGRRLGAMAVIAVGIPAALAMLPYLDIAGRLNSWQPLVQVHFTFEIFKKKLTEVLVAQGGGMLGIWLGLFAAALIAGAIAQMRRRVPGLTDEQRDRAFFGLLSLLIYCPLHWLFLKKLSYLTEPWYYFALVAVCACSFESIFRVVRGHLRLRQISWAVIVAVVASSLLLNYRQVTVRMTNVDLDAEMLMQQAGPKDLIVVRPWYAGITFERYYHGTTPWMTVPDVPSHRYHRFDVVMNLMRDNDHALDPVYDAITKTLKGGHRVWMAGGLPAVGRKSDIIHLQPAPDPNVGWTEGVYSMSWAQHISYFLQNNADQVDWSALGDNVNPYENLMMMVVWDWNPAPELTTEPR